ncbi:hypothetical protein ACGFW5_14135 [Streptomyces sp. NPDC048416]|uniref:hypothetical protein n=1 Tax=Streptomyces sp. NPDC048416 TaxID=3365546 RepID=UPI003721A9C6
MAPDAAPVQGTEGCGPCSVLSAQLRHAVQERDQSAEVDARVRIRRHMRQDHGTELPLPSHP